ncbi:MAG: hypothetical protein HYR64_00010 [Fimbriimonas ginsengisoli]|uniref:Uncharacterized protein n=1 Tax=Fimbriimonas ginsengisoli TaxID=1005039 RepID=A0A931PSN1_FIMGI|nr:hypothetical protein [Fimbriimonas ginsengisoli]
MTALLIFGIFLLFAYPFLFREAPHTRYEKGLFAIRLTTYVAILLLTFFGVALTAVVALRRARQELREEAKQNLRELIEGTLRDHGKADGRPS